MSKKYWNLFIIFILTISIITATSIVHLQAKEVSDQKNSKVGNSSGKVILGGQVILEIKNSADKFSAEQRAENFSNELKSIAEGNDIILNDLYIETEEENRIIFFRKPLITLTKEDAISENKSIEKLEKEYKEKITEVVNKYREENLEKNSLAPLVTLSIFFGSLVIIFFPFFGSWLKFKLRMTWNWCEKYPIRYIWNPTIGRSLKYFNNLLEKIPGNKESENFEDKYKVGSVDNTDKLIEYIYHSHNDYIIYRTNKRVCWLFSDKSENEKQKQKQKEYEERVNKIIEYLAIIEFRRPQEIETLDTINLLTAKGIELALEGEHDSATKIFKQAKEKVESFWEKNIKLRYLMSSFYTTIAFLVVIFIWISLPKTTFFSEWIINPMVEFNISPLFLIVISCGTLGGFLSVASGINRISIDPDSDVMRAGMSRIYIAVISSIIIYIALQSGLLSDLSNFLLNSAKTEWKVALISAAAGFTESLVPNLLKKLSNKGTSNEQIEEKKAHQSEGSNGNLKKEKSKALP